VLPVVARRWVSIDNTYISAFSSTKWEDWRHDWVIAMADTNDCLELPTEGPLLDRSC
jgi:hypothetical protein